MAPTQRGEDVRPPGLAAQSSPLLGFLRLQKAGSGTRLSLRLNIWLRPAVPGTLQSARHEITHGTGSTRVRLAVTVAGLSVSHQGKEGVLEAGEPTGRAWNGRESRDPAWTTASWGSQACLSFLKPTGDPILVWLTLSTTGWLRCGLVGKRAWEQSGGRKGVAEAPWRALLEGILLHPLLSVFFPPGRGSVGSAGLAGLCTRVQASQGDGPGCGP